MKYSIFLIAKYIKNPSGSYDESVGFTRRIKDRDLRNCQVIIDLINRTVIKCSATENNETFGNRSFDDIYQYFYQHYQQALDSVAGPISTQIDK